MTRIIKNVIKKIGERNFVMCNFGQVAGVIMLLLGQSSGQECEYTECDGDKCEDPGDKCCDGWYGGTNQEHCAAGWTRVNGEGLPGGGCSTFSLAGGGVSFTCCKTHKGTVAQIFQGLRCCASYCW